MCEQLVKFDSKTGRKVQSSLKVVAPGIDNNARIEAKLFE